MTLSFIVIDFRIIFSCVHHNEQYGRSTNENSMVGQTAMNIDENRTFNKSCS